jgi:hypothetical protein
MNAYIDAYSEYVGLMSSQNSSAADAQKWNVLGSTLKKRVAAALNDWEVDGHRAAVEGAAAYVDNVNAGAMDIILKNMRDALKTPRQVDDDPYFATTLLSNAFATSTNGWTDQWFYENDFHSISKSHSASWGGSIGLNVGLFGLGGSASGSSFDNSKQIDTTNFSMRYKLTLVPLIRGWYHPEFLRSKSWRFKDGFKNMVSDGGVPPQGLLTAYTTTAIMVRDVFISFSNASQFQHDYGSAVQGGGSVGWGPISLSASYGQSDGTSESKAHSKGEGIYIPGMQVIGFVCKLLPKSPDTAPGVFK